MGTISSSVGLISGFNTADLVKQLMAIEARPLNQVKSQIEAAKKEQTAYLELNARLLSALGAVRRLALPSSFTVRKATSSNPEAISASASASTPAGTYALRVHSLATTHQLVSAGLPDRDRTPVGGGTLTFEIGAGRVDAATPLAALNGGQGIRRGVIRITDRNGGSADVDLRAASTLDDVLEAINGQSGASLRAEVDGDRLVLTDTSGATTGSLRVQDLSGGFAAADLGIAGSSSTGTITGGDVVRLTDGTRLSTLNDGLGVRVDGLNDDLLIVLKNEGEIRVSLSSNLKFTTKLAALNDGRGVRLPGQIRLTNRAGQSAEITLAGATTIQDVVTAINSAGLSLTASLAGSKLSITDSSGGTVSNLKIEDVSGYAAADLGIVADRAENGVSGAAIYRVETVGGVLRAIQYAENNDGKVTAAISADGKGIVLTDVAGNNDMTLGAVGGSKALEDLGLAGASLSGGTIASRRLVAGLNTVLLSSLNGGQGVGVGVVEFTRRDGATIQVDFTGAQTLSEVLNRINEATDGLGAPAGLTATVDPGGAGILIQDASTGGGTFSAVDLTGSTAADLHWTSAAADRLTSGDLQLKTISETTLLSNLNAAAGIKYGTFRITAADGSFRDVTLSSSLHRTLGDVIKAINADTSFKVTARVNSDGDGLELVDASGGGGRLAVAERNGGGTAASLGLLGEAAAGATVLTGSFARKVVIAGTDTLDKVAEKINAAGAGLSARVLNDGSPTSPYRLVITSSATGTRGAITYSTGTTGLSLATMTRAQDAVVSVGDGNSPNPILLTSGVNSITGLVDGLKLDLNAVTSQTVSVTVAQNVDAVVNDIKSFVSAFNATVGRISELTKFVPDTGERGVLLGDSTVATVRDRLYAAVTRRLPDSGLVYRSLNQVGVTVGSGATLQFDETQFRAAYEADPEAVKTLFTQVTKDGNGKTVNVGIAGRLKEVIEGLTASSTGTLNLQNNALQDRVDLLNRRATDMQALLDRKEARLYAQFQAMERALADLQSQQSALNSLSSQLAALANRK